MIFFQLVYIFIIGFMLDVWLCSEYARAVCVIILSKIFLSNLICYLFLFLLSFKALS